MLRNKSRAVTSKQAIMADHSSLPSLIENYIRPISYFLGSPKFFKGFMTKGSTDTEAVMSPTSILDTKQFSSLGNPFGYDKKQTKPQETFSGNKHSWEKLDSRGIGLALIDDRIEENSSKPSSRMVLFGSKLKIQVPPLPPSPISPAGLPKSPADFGIKTRNSQLGSLSPFGSANSSNQTKDSPRVFVGCLSTTEMELSEDYTCVIAHGPNPRTTHIFDNCIVDSCCGVAGLSALRKEYSSFSAKSENFLSFCYTCKKSLGLEKDIYMYRGEKAFCSRECRSQEIMFDGVENS